MTDLIIADTTILQDPHGRYDFTPLYKKARPEQHWFVEICEFLAEEGRQKNKPKKEYALYFFQSKKTLAIKIGMARNIKKRMNYLEKTHGYPLRILHHFFSSTAAKYEKKLHAHWAKYRLEGEWFSLPAGMNTEQFVLDSLALIGISEKKDA